MKHTQKERTNEIRRLSGKLRKLKRKLEKAEKRKVRVRSVQSLIPITDVTGGLICTKDRRYIKAAEFSPVNISGLDSDRREEITASFRLALRAMPVRAQIKCMRTRPDISGMLAPMEAAMEEEKDAACRRLMGGYIRMLKEENIREGSSVRFFLILEYRGRTDRNMSEVKRVLESAMGRIASLMLSFGCVMLDTLESDRDIISWLHEYFCPGDDLAQRVAETRKRQGGSTRIRTADFFSPPSVRLRPGSLKTDKRHMVFGYISGASVPRAIPPAWLEEVIGMRSECDVDIFFEKLPAGAVSARIGRRIRNNRAKMRGTSDTTADFFRTRDLVKSGEYLLKGLSRSEEMVKVGVLITAYGSSEREAEEALYTAKEKAAQRGAGLVRVKWQVRDAFLSRIPTARARPRLWKRMARNMLTTSRAAYFPFISCRMKDEGGILLGQRLRDSSLVAVNVFDTSRHANANGLIIGSSGYGKTYTGLLFAVRMRMMGIRIFIISPAKGKEDYLRVTRALGGQFLEFGKETGGHINIMDPAVPDENSEESSPVSDRVGTVKTFLSLACGGLSPPEEGLCDGCILKTYSQKGLTDGSARSLNRSNADPRTFPTLKDLYMNMKEIKGLERVSGVLSAFAEGSLSGYSRHTDISLDSMFTVFDMESRRPGQLSIAMFTALSFVWNEIKRDRTQRKAVFIDEAWKLAGASADRMTASFIREMFKTIRGYGASAFVMTQEVSDLLSGDNRDLGRAVAANTDLKICLHVDRADMDRAREIMEMSEEEKDSVLHMHRGTGLLKSGANRLAVRFAASEEERMLLEGTAEYNGGQGKE